MISWYKSLSPKNQIKIIIVILSFLTSTYALFIGKDYLNALQINTTFNANANANANAKASSSNNSNVDIYLNTIGNRQVKVSPIFDSPEEACYHYLANYRNLYPYVIANKSDNEYPHIQAIALDAYWEGQSCKKNNKGQFQLIGIERTVHNIEIKINKQANFVLVAKGYGIYRSKLIFDDYGRFTERTVLPDERIHIIEEKHSNIVLKNISLERIPGTNDGFYNYLKVVPEKNMNIEDLRTGKYALGIKSYIKKRDELHAKLVTKGCGVISTEPINTNIKNETIKIAFLCFDSHVRVMEQVNK